MSETAAKMLPMIAGIGAMMIPGMQWWGVMLITAAATYVSIEWQESLMDDEVSFTAMQERGTRVNTRSTKEPLKIVYGTMKSGLNDVYIKLIGTDNKYLWLVSTLSEGECDSIFQVGSVDQAFLNDTIYTEFGSLVSYWFHSGSSTQTFDTNINAVAPEFIENMRHTCYIVWKLEFDRDYFQSLPRRTLILKGKKLYDYRNTSTVWSDNPPLCIYDFLTNKRYGLGYAASKIDVTSWTAAANYCDAKDFTCNMLISEIGAYTIVEQMLKLFRGELVWWNGKLFLRYADSTVETSIMTINDEHVVRDQSGKAALRISQGPLFNKPDGLQVTFLDKTKDYIEDSIVVGADYGNIQRIDLPGCTNREMAGIIGNYALERLILNRRISGTFRGDTIKLEQRDFMTFNSSALAISDQEMRVESSVINPDQTIQLQLQYESDDLYNDTYDANIDEVYSVDLPDPSESLSVKNVRVREESYEFRLEAHTRLKFMFDAPNTFFDFADVWIMAIDPDNLGADESGNDNDATLGTGVISESGVQGKCAGLDGVNSEINCGNGSPLDELGDGSFSVVLWEKSADLSVSGYDTFFSKYEDATKAILLRSQDDDTGVEYKLMDGSTVVTSIVSDIDVFDQEWNMLGLVVDRSIDVALLYHQGVLADSTDINVLNEDLSNAGDLIWGSR